MSVYVTQAQIEAEIPPPLLNDALDDNRDGMADDGQLAQVIQNASDTVDGLVCGRYEVPLAAPIPASAKRAAFVFACETIYRRRAVADGENPFKREADEWRKRLAAIGRGEGLLDTTTADVLAANSGGQPYVPGRVPVEGSATTYS